MAQWRKNKTITTLYKFYKQRKKKDVKLDKKQFESIAKDLFLLIQDHLISGKTYYPPYGMGEFKPHKYKPRKTRPRNYNEEKKYFAKTGEWKKIYYQNFHTGGYKVKITWFKKGYPLIPAGKFYRFYVNRNLRLRLGKELLKYGDVDKYLHTTKITRLSNTKTLI